MIVQYNAGKNDLLAKWHRFLKSDNKIERLYEKAWTTLINMYYKRKFGGFGAGSSIVAPDRLIGCRHVFLGEGCSILHHARLEAIERYGNQYFEPRLIIGDRTSIGQNFHCIAGGNLIIGQDVLMSGNIYISDVLHDWHDVGVPVARQLLVCRTTRVGNLCFVGYGSAILPGAILGDQCIVGSNAVVGPGEYPAMSVLVGVPARIVRKYDLETGIWERVRT